MCVATCRSFQEKQLQEAAKNNEEAQAVINQLRTSLQQLENRFKQARERARRRERTQVLSVLSGNQLSLPWMSWQGTTVTTSRCRGGHARFTASTAATPTDL